MTDRDPHRQQGGHGWMMLICCIPMLVIAVAIAIAGGGGWRFLFAAVVCTLMMGAMMGAMSGGDRR